MTVTGYKPQEIGIFQDDHPGIGYIKKALKKSILSKAEEGLEWVLISGQPGVELWAAEVIFEIQEQIPDLKLAVIPPFLNQEERWKDALKEEYQMIIASADFFDVLTKKNYENPGQFKLKNKFFIDKSDGLLIFYNEDQPGVSKYLLDAAKEESKKSGYYIEYITPFDIEMIIEEEQMNDPDYWG